MWIDACGPEWTSRRVVSCNSIPISQSCSSDARGDMSVSLSADSLSDDKDGELGIPWSLIEALPENDDTDLSLALTLQQQVDLGEASCALLGDNSTVTNDLAGPWFQGNDGDNVDESLAAALQCSLYEEDRKEEEERMVHTREGRAWKFVEKVLQLHEDMLVSNGNPDNNDTDDNGNNSALLMAHVSAVATDAMVFQTERMLALQEQLFVANKPTAVDIGYHYTKAENMHRIKTDGLMNKAERDQKHIQSKYNGSSYGDGIYTADSPCHFHGSYGDIGLLVARLKGQTSPSKLPPSGSSTADTCHSGRVVVLRRSDQCVALMQFASRLIDPSGRNRAGSGNQLVREYHAKLQAIVDDFFNDQKPPPPAVSSGRHRLSLGDDAFDRAQARPIAIGIPVDMSSSLSGPRQVLRYTAPEVIDSSALEPDALIEIDTRSSSSSWECMACWNTQPPHPSSLSPSSSKTVCLRVCGHEFHEECILQSVRDFHKCPVCFQHVGKPTPGTMPSGTMSVTTVHDQHCDPSAAGCIVIKYDFPRARQKKHHQNPGQYHDGAVRKAYLPNHAAGRSLLKRLQFAFEHGLSFTVGTSLSTKRPNSVTWSSIPHKTSLAAGEHGYPDPTYLDRCNAVLDALGVPAADALIKVPPSPGVTEG